MSKVNSIKWEKNKYAPIPDYSSTDRRWRIFKSQHRGWCLQDRCNQNHPEPILFTGTMRDAKSAAMGLVGREAEGD